MVLIDEQTRALILRDVAVWAKEKYAIYNKTLETARKQAIKEEIYEIIDDFYGDYSPKTYKRKGNPSSHTGGMYDMFDIVFDKSKDPWKAIYNVNISNEQNEIIYYNSFVKGWHGGAANNETGGLHLWRNPRTSPKYSAWLWDHPNYEGGQVPKYSVSIEKEMIKIVNKNNKPEISQAAEDVVFDAVINFDDIYDIITKYL